MSAGLAWGRSRCGRADQCARACCQVGRSQAQCPKHPFQGLSEHIIQPTPASCLEQIISQLLEKWQRVHAFNPPSLPVFRTYRFVHISLDGPLHTPALCETRSFRPFFAVDSRRTELATCVSVISLSPLHSDNLVNVAPTFISSPRPRSPSP